MAQAPAYDYRELAFDNYEEAHALLRKLVAMREMRDMRQEDLADEMGVTQGYISQIENGRTGLLDRLNDYAIEVGARITYHVEPAEKMPRGRRYTTIRVSGSEYGMATSATWTTPAGNERREALGTSETNRQMTADYMAARFVD